MAIKEVMGLAKQAPMTVKGTGHVWLIKEKIRGVLITLFGYLRSYHTEEDLL